eukprot:gene20147-26157_t
MSKVLKPFTKECPLSRNEGVVLHFNVGHLISKNIVNMFLLEYIVIGTWFDDTGAAFPRHNKDIIVVELCNTGYRDERDRISITHHIPILPIIYKLSCYEFKAIPSYRSRNIDVYLRNLVDHAIKAVITFHNRQMDKFKPHEILLESMSSMKAFSFEMNHVDNLTSNNIFDYLNVVWTLPDGTVLPNDVGNLVAVNNTVLYDYQKHTNSGIGATLLDVRNLPIPSDDALDQAVRALALANEIDDNIRECYVRRFYSVASTQLNYFYQSFSFWETAIVCEEDANFVLALTFHYMMLIIENSRDFAKPMMIPQDISNERDDVSRFCSMEGFDKWSERPFFLCTSSSFQTLSAANFDPIQYIISKLKGDEQFISWLTEHQRLLEPYNRKKLQNLCDCLSVCPFDPDGTDSKLKQFFQLLGCFQDAVKMIDLIEIINSKKLSGMEHLDQLKDHLDCINWFKTKVKSPIISVSDLKNHAYIFLNDLFGNNEKPSFRLTVGSIIRLAAIQIRNLCKIPICMIGETGSGKTELLSFSSGINGSHFHIVNVHEGFDETVFSRSLNTAIKDAILNPGVRVTCILDEANATYNVWLTKDMLCDGILNGYRLPSNINFVIILNPAKLKSEVFSRAEEESSVGGIDFRRYQNIYGNQQLDITNSHKANLVYQVHTSPETLYSFAWDFGNASTTKVNVADLPLLSSSILLDNQQRECTDEAQLSSSMVDWLIKILKDNENLSQTFRRHGDVSGDAYFWKPFRTILVELMLQSQNFVRKVFGGELSVVSLRDIRNTCQTIAVIFKDFYGAASVLRPDLVTDRKNASFTLLTKSIHCALIRVYCLRFDSKRRREYLVEIHRHWKYVRDRFHNLESSFLSDPPLNPSTVEDSSIYRSFDELANLVIADLISDRDIAPNQALKENTLSMLLTIWMRSTLFIVGRPGSTKSRALELLCEASISGNIRKSFISVLGLIIHKFVVQCSPDTTAEHVNSQARRAAIAQYKQSQLLKERHQVVLVLEEVGATIGSRHNPLMSLHQLIDHGIPLQIRGEAVTVRIPIIGISNYRLDGSKMGRGSIVHRGNPSVDDHDLTMTAKTILRFVDNRGDTEFTRPFSQAFCYNILQDQHFTWYHGMRDFYSSVSTIQRLTIPTIDFIQPKQSQIQRRQTQLTSHIVRWAMLINLQGFPTISDEERLLKIMSESFQLPKDTVAIWDWRSHPNNPETSMKLCDACCRMQLYVKFLQHKSKYPEDDFEPTTMKNILNRHATQLTVGGVPCEYFNTANYIPAIEVISYSLWEKTSRHQMIFTKANAALPLLFSQNILRREACTTIFNSLEESHSTSTSERVQQMMRIKACLREGKTLILVRARHLYEALLDALNVHYVKDMSTDGDILHKTMLSMAGITQSVFVRPTFRCIALEDRDELKEHVMPPLINRFSKATLTYASALSQQQRLVRKFITSHGIVQLEDKNKKKEDFQMIIALAP